MHRRELLTVAGASVALWPSLALKASSWGTFTEEQRGDPDLPRESISLDAEAIQNRVTGLASYRNRLDSATMAATVFAIAKPMIGWSRAETPERIADILDVFDLQFKDDKGRFVPFCAAGVAYAFAAAYLKSWGVASSTNALRGALQEIDRYHFYPSPSVMDVYYVARGKRRWVDAVPGKVTPKPGWLVVYDWSGTQRGADHVGLVTGLDAQGLHTIEFNTSQQNQKNGGQVAARTRQYNKFVRGFVRTDIKTPI